MKLGTYGKSYTFQQYEEVEAFSRTYRDFLDRSKTERECVKAAIEIAEAAGYEPLEGKKGLLCAGDKVYTVHMGKMVAFFHIGCKPIESGLFIVGAHIDSPRLDLKQRPLYENEGLAYFDTHYYGGIKKYQWVALPLALHGVAVKKDGSTVEIQLGDQEDEPVFCISDLLIHLAAEQQEKTGSKVVEGEKLDLLIGSIPITEKEKDAVKANILCILNNEYGLIGEDFLSAEIEVVPAGRAREMGIDRSMLLGYGHDDRACAYASLEAMLNLKIPTHTACCILLDKEEIGSMGATGAQSSFFETAIAEIMERTQGFNELKMRRSFLRSSMLSADVSAAYDPLYPEVFDRNNSAHIGKGVAFNKYTGSHGKFGTNDANAEYIAFIRRIMDKANIDYQMAELGRVDAGGGGTIANFFAKHGLSVMDCGVPVLNMHAPWEIISKIDLYEAFRCYRAFFEQG